MPLTSSTQTLLLPVLKQSRSRARFHDPSPTPSKSRFNTSTRSFFSTLRLQCQQTLQPRPRSTKQLASAAPSSTSSANPEACHPSPHSWTAARTAPNHPAASSRTAPTTCPRHLSSPSNPRAASTPIATRGTTVVSTCRTTTPRRGPRANSAVVAAGVAAVMNINPASCMLVMAMSRHDMRCVRLLIVDGHQLRIL